MVVTFTKIKFSDLPQAYQDAILSFSDDQIVIDETLLTPEQQQKGLDWLTQQGYKQQ